MRSHICCLGACDPAVSPSFFLVWQIVAGSVHFHSWSFNFHVFTSPFLSFYWPVLPFLPLFLSSPFPSFPQTVSACLTIFLFMCLFLYRACSPSVCLLWSLSVSLTHFYILCLCLSASRYSSQSLPIYQSLCISYSLSGSLFLCFFFSMSVSQAICLSVSFNICSVIFLFVCLIFCVPVSVSLILSLFQPLCYY